MRAHARTPCLCVAHIAVPKVPLYLPSQVPLLASVNPEWEEGACHICEVQLQLQGFTVARQVAHHFYGQIRSAVADNVSGKEKQDGLQVRRPPSRLLLRPWDRMDPRVSPTPHARVHTYAQIPLRMTWLPAVAPTWRLEDVLPNGAHACR
jgi:hypothetical protein